MATVESLISLLFNTPSPVTLLKHTQVVGIPLYFIEAIASVSGEFHKQPWSKEEMMAIEEFRKKKAPPVGDEVFKNILIGNKGAAQDASFLKDTGVTHLLNCAGNPESPDIVKPDLDKLDEYGIKVLQLVCNDKPDVSIRDHFPVTIPWMKEALDGGGKVMVNCFQGASRSATVVLAYLIQNHHLKVDEALELVKKKRDIRPNNGFLQQLIDLDNQVNK